MILLLMSPDAQRKLAAIEAAIAQGDSVNAACRRLGVARGSFYRWKREAEAEQAEQISRKSRGDAVTGHVESGDDGLRPASSPGGRPARFRLTEAETAALRRHRLDTDSLNEAIRRFLSDPACEADTRREIQEIFDTARQERVRVRWPQSLRRAGFVAPEQRAQHRGRKHAQDFELPTLRDMVWQDEQGETWPLGALDLYESDDMSLNQPFRAINPETGQAEEGRQVLFTVDVFAGGYLGAQPVSRPRDAYRVEDIADHCLNTVDAWGLPIAWRFERGPWDCDFINGIRLDKLGSQFRGKRWGALDDIMHVIRSWSSRGKGTVESSFDHLQTILSRLHDTPDIGRVRGEFEADTKTFLKAKRGDAKSQSKIWTIGEAAEGLVDACQEFNDRQKTRRGFQNRAVTPNELLESRREKRELPDAQRWYFLPVKRLVSVRQNRVSISVDHWPKSFEFVVNGVRDGVYLSHNYKVLVAMHPGRPEEGCWIFNAEVGEKNTKGYKFGQPLLIAEPVQSPPQFSLASDRSSAAEQRKQARAAMVAEYRSIVPRGASRKEREEHEVRETTARDGLGNALTSRQGPARSDLGDLDEDEIFGADDSDRVAGMVSEEISEREGRSPIETNAPLRRSGMVPEENSGRVASGDGPSSHRQPLHETPDRSESPAATPLQRRGGALRGGDRKREPEQVDISDDDLASLDDF